MKDKCSFCGSLLWGNMVLHRLGKPGIQWRHLLPRRVSEHIAIIILRRIFRPNRFSLRNYRFGCNLVPPSSRCVGPWGHPGGLAPGMPSGTACELLLLLGGLAVVLAICAFPRLTLLALGAVSVTVTVLATHTKLVPTVPPCFHTSGLGTLA